jgi:energy-coupling factor transport system permease protein
MFSYLASASPLHRLNPAAKLGALAAVAAGATLSFDPFIPAALALGLWLASWLLGRVPLRRLLRWTLPLLLLPLPLAAFTALYADLSDVADPQILWRWGPWTLAWEGLRTGIGLGLRVTCFLATSLLFLTTTDPADFAISLIQNLKVPYRFGYGVLISYRFLPLLRSEFETIRLAHRVRGAGRRAGLLGGLEQMRRFAIPLLAAALRKSERAALAMDAKAFGSGQGRTYYRQMRVGGADLVFLLGALGYTAAVYWLALRAGLADLQWIPDV